MDDITGKPSEGERRCAPDGPKPAGRTCRSRQAKQGRKQAPARTCAPKSARPDQRAAPPPHNEAPGDERAGMPQREPHFEDRQDSRSSKPQTLSQRGAMALAKRLQKYWHEKGFPAARFWAEPIDERFKKVGTYEIYRVASNLVNGLPPRYRDQAAPPRKR